MNKIVTVLGLAWLSGAVAPAQVGPGGPGAAEAIRSLRLGNQRFASGETLEKAIDEGTRRSVAARHRPYAIVVCPSDSRIAPEHVFDAGLGELYVVRVAGNTCDPATLASIEFAAEHLGISCCVVMGHDRCATLTQADADDPQTPAGTSLAERLTPSLRRAARDGLVGPDRIAQAADDNVHRTILDAVRRSTILRHRIHAGRFEFAPARYESASGAVVWLTPRPLDAALAVDSKGRSAERKIRVRGLPPHVALRMLQAGHRRALSRPIASGDVSPARRESIVASQHPFAIVIADSDARVAPELLFDVGLGELFVVRVVGPVLDDEIVASVEHAIVTTGASLVIALGHDANAAIEFALTATPHPSRISAGLSGLAAWLEPSLEAARREGARGTALRDRTVALNSLRVLQELRKRSEIVRASEGEGAIALLAGLLHVATGDLDWIDELPAAAQARPAAAPLGEHEPLHRARTAHPGDHAGQGHDAMAAHAHEPHGAAGHDANGHGAASGHAPAPSGHHTPHGHDDHAPGAPVEAAPHDGHGGHAAPEHHVEPANHATPVHGAHGTTPTHGAATRGHDGGHGAANLHGDAHGHANPTGAHETAHGTAHVDDPSHDGHDAAVHHPAHDDGHAVTAHDAGRSPGAQPTPPSLLSTFLIAFGVAIGGIGAILVAKGRDSAPAVSSDSAS